MLTFRDINKSFKLDGGLSEIMTNYDHNVSFSNPQDQKLIYKIGKEMKFNIRQKEEKVLEINLLKNYLSHLLSRLRKFLQSFYQKILMSFVID